MITEKITITTDISDSQPVRRVHIKVGNRFDFHQTYGDDDNLEEVLGSVAIGIENKFREDEYNALDGEIG